MFGGDHNPGFRLERVLEHRKRLTESAQQALAERIRERASVEAALDLLSTEQAALVEYLEENLADDALDLNALTVADVYAGRLRRSANRQRRAWQEAQAREAEALNDLLLRRVDQKVLEKLRERQQEEFEARMRAAEERLLDEIATMRRGPQAAQPGGTDER